MAAIDVLISNFNTISYDKFLIWIWTVMYLMFSDYNLNHTLKAFTWEHIWIVLPFSIVGLFYKRILVSYARLSSQLSTKKAPLVVNAFRQFFNTPSSSWAEVILVFHVFNIFVLYLFCIFLVIVFLVYINTYEYITNYERFSILTFLCYMLHWQWSFIAFWLCFYISLERFWKTICHMTNLVARWIFKTNVLWNSFRKRCTESLWKTIVKRIAYLFLY